MSMNTSKNGTTHTNRGSLMKKGWTKWMVAAAALIATPVLASPGPSKDVLGRQLPEDGGRPTVVIYTNRGTEDSLGKHALPMLYDLRDENPRVVVKVDLRDVPGLFHGTARGKIKQGYYDSLRDMEQLFAKKGEKAPKDMAQQFFLVADSKGESHQAVGLAKGFDVPVVQAFGADGRELARGAFPKARAKVERALTGSAAVASN